MSDIEKKYVLFAGHRYYPRGIEDFRAIGSLDHLKDMFKENAGEWSIEEGGYLDPWGQIAEHETMKIVLEWNYKHGWLHPDDEKLI